MKKTLVLVLSVVMLASMLVMPAFAAEEGAAGPLLNDLSDYGQMQFDATVHKTPVIDGVISDDEYAAKQSLFYFAGDTGPYDLFASSDASNVYLGIRVDESVRSPGLLPAVAANENDFIYKSGVRFFINFPTDCTAKDANNYLIFHLSYSLNETPMIGVTCTGDEAFVARMEEKVAGISKCNGDVRQIVNIGADLISTRIVTACAMKVSGANGGTVGYELALNRSKLASIFGWDNASSMTVLSAIRYGNSWPATMSDTFGNADAAAALEASSAALGDESAVAPYVYDVWAWAPVDDVIPAVVILTEGNPMPTVVPEHVHDYNTDVWGKNDVAHFHTCECGENADVAVHTFDAGTVTKEPTADAKGEKTYTCTECGYQKTEKLDKLAPPSTDGDTEDSGGCGGVIAISALATVSAAVAVVLVVKKKKD